MERTTSGGAPPSITDFRSAYREELPFVCNALVRLGARGEDVRDLAHDVFATAYRRWDTYQPMRPIRPWLFGIAYRVFLDFRRKRSNHEHPGELPVDLHVESRVEEWVATRQAHGLVVRILETLDLDQRAVFVMHDLEGSTVPEIAEALGIPLNTAYSRLRLARNRFNAAVAELHRQEGSR